MQNTISSLRYYFAISRMLSVIAIVAVAILSVPLALTAEDGNGTEFTFTFDSDAEGWLVGFADLPVDYDQSIYELDHAHRPLPDSLERLRMQVSAALGTPTALSHF